MEKQAGLDGLLKTIKDFASNNKEMIIGGLAGSGLGAIGGYNLVDDYGLSEDEAYNARLRGGIIGGLTGLLGGGLAGHLVGTAGGAAAAGSGGENDKPKLENTPTPAASGAQGEAPAKAEDTPAPAKVEDTPAPLKAEYTPADSDTSERVSTDADGPDYEPAGGYIAAAGAGVGTGVGAYAGGRMQARHQAKQKERTKGDKNRAQSAKTKAVMDRGKYKDTVAHTNDMYRDVQQGKVRMINPATGKVMTADEAKQIRQTLGKAVAPEMKAYNKTVAETAAAYNKALAKQVKATAIARKAPRTAGRVGGGVLGALAGLGMTLLGQNAVDYSQGE